MLTQKKRLYAEARVAGKGKAQSAILAGCPARTAPQAASRYEKDPDVVGHMSRVMNQAEKPKPAKAVRAVKNSPDPESVPPSHPPADAPSDAPEAPDDDPLAYLRDVMKNPNEDPRLRLDAAKTLAAYMHPKPGEKGKKEAKQDAAQKAASKFAAAVPPRLVAAGGKKV